MLYQEQLFTKELFKNPGKEFRGAPFWAWNTKLEKDKVLGQVDQFAKMGMGGFMIHTRVGLDTDYMGAEFMDIVKACVQKAKEKDLFCWLYDEDRWPSGYGGGYVTKEKKYRSRYLAVTPYKQNLEVDRAAEFDSCASASVAGTGDFLVAFQVKLNEKGELVQYEKCGEEEKAKSGFDLWYVYLEIAQDSPWFNNQAYVDTLNPEAVRRFLDLTHEKYYQELGKEFGRTIPAIFTDEPQFPHKQLLGFARSKSEIILPFTDDFEISYQKQYGESFLDKLPEIMWELPGGAISKTRYNYHDHLAERFARAYSDQVGQWCDEHGIKLCGHMMEEPTLYSQTRALGEVMRNLRGFALPGIDMLCDLREYSTVKQAQSVSHQYGREGVASELYGVTNWDFDLRRHKLQGDWMAALGVTSRIHHLTWMSMGGEAKRDYPASIGFQSPWYEKYPSIEDHFARVNTAMTRGKALVRIGIIHPVESYWLYFGPNQQTCGIRAELEQNFTNITEWLLFDLLDYDYISEALIPDLYKENKLGEMDYDVILVPGCKTLRGTTVAYLKREKERGKHIVFVGELPTHMDALEDGNPGKLAMECTRIPYSRHALQQILEPFRVLDIHYRGTKIFKKPKHKKNWDGERTQKYIYQMREEKGERWLFIANGKPVENPDLIFDDKLQVTIQGEWQPTLLNSMNGEIQEIEADYKEGTTIIYPVLFEYDSLLLHLTPGRSEKKLQMKAPKVIWEKNCNGSLLNIKRKEPNVLVLDMAEYSFDHGQWEEREEILRIDNICRDKAKYPQRKAALAQPWVIGNEAGDGHLLELRYQISCREDIGECQLGMEGLDKASFQLDEKQILLEMDGYYIDPCIQKAKLPPLTKGRHILQVSIPFGQKTNVESIYLLGEFSIDVLGDHAVMGQDEACGYYFGSLTGQGMPFYGGNVDYVLECDLGQGSYEIEISKYRGALLSVFLDGEAIGDIMCAPYRLPFEIIRGGKHIVTVTCYGNRINTFGTLHDCDENEIYFDPNAWRTQKDSWAYEYQLKKTGILKAPVIRRLEH
ncbi:MAG TPA: hypothetical protein GXX75_04815 [Clostridiales bacterium]|nr:hypothetical protein [Clostridiales bacterium]